MAHAHHTGQTARVSGRGPKHIAWPPLSSRRDWRCFYKLNHSWLSYCLQFLPFIPLTFLAKAPYSVSVCPTNGKVPACWFSSLQSPSTPASPTLICSLLGVPQRTILVAWGGAYLGFSSGLRATMEGRSCYSLLSSSPGHMGST